MIAISYPFLTMSMSSRLLKLRREAMRIVSAFAIFLLLAPSASAAEFFWAGNYADSDRWENPTNWSISYNGYGGAGVPGYGDMAVFHTGTGSKTARIRSSVSVGGIKLNNAWTGSLLLGTGTLKIGTGGLRIGSGYFVGGTGPISLSGSYTQTGGIVRGLMNKFNLSGSLSVTGANSVFTSTGTVIFSGKSNQTLTPGVKTKFSGAILNSRGTTGANSVIVAGLNLGLSGALTINTGKLDLTTNSKNLSVWRDMTIGAGATANLTTNSNVALSGSLSVGAITGLTVTGGTWTFNGSRNQTVDLGGGKLWNVNLSNTNKAGSHSVVVSTNPFNLSGALTIATGKLDLTTNSMAIRTRGITINNHASGALVTNSNVTNSGSVTISGSSPTVTISAGTWTQISQSNTTLNFAGKPVYNFTLNNTGVAGSKTETLGGALNMSGSLTITSGILDTSTSGYGMSITGNMNNSVTFNANGSAITVGGNWTTQAAGSFTEGTSTVTMNGTNKTLSGSTTFYRFAKSPSGNDTLNFAVGTTTTTTNRLTLTSAAGALSLRSTTDGSRYTIAAVGNVYTIGTLNVKDSNASYTIVCQDCTNSGNNSDGWVFTTTSASTTTTSGTSGGGSGGGGGRSYLNTGTPASVMPAPRAPVIPATKVTPPGKSQAPKTLSERLQERKQAREAALARIKARAAQRKAKSRR